MDKLNSFIFILSILSIVNSIIAIYFLFGRRKYNQNIEEEIENKIVKILQQFEIDLQKSLDNSKWIIENELQQFENLLKNINLNLGEIKQKLGIAISDLFYFKDLLQTQSGEIEKYHEKIDKKIKERDAVIERLRKQLVGKG